MGAERNAFICGDTCFERISIPSKLLFKFSLLCYATTKSDISFTASAAMSSELTLASIQDLHVDMIVAIFARLGLRDLCNIELGL